MPIRPENKNRYPKNWREISLRIRDRAENKCEQCGVGNGAWLIRKGGKRVRVVLTVAHLDHQPENCAPSNLRAWCQKCHNAYDAPMRARGIKERRRADFAIGDLFSARR